LRRRTHLPLPTSHFAVGVPADTPNAQSASLAHSHAPPSQVPDGPQTRFSVRFVPVGASAQSCGSSAGAPNSPIQIYCLHVLTIVTT